MMIQSLCKSLTWLCVIAGSIFITGCSSWKVSESSSDDKPVIFPDYTDVTVPHNIAPLNFMMKDAARVQATFSVDGEELLRLSGREGMIRIPLRKWQSMMSQSMGNTISVTVEAWSDEFPAGVSYKPFDIVVSEDGIDPYISYRLIEPGYEGWRQLGIYQRDLSTFEESAIVTNRNSNTTCINCHSYPSYSPESMMFHARGANGGTIIYQNGKLTKVKFNELGPKVNTTYPAWHPDGRYIAFSSNSTFQAFYGEGKQPVEVYDTASDIVIYDTSTGEVLTDPRFLNDESMETFPAWTPDGKYLYYVAAQAYDLPVDLESVHYSVCRVRFYDDSGTLGDDVELVYDSESEGGSASFPRVSPDGRYMLYTYSDCGTFPIWHDTADLRMIDLETGVHTDVELWNSDTTADSYHSWSSNGRWVVFSSRRLGGRYTRLYVAGFDSEGRPGKPFLLPQENPLHNTWRLTSYNIPEFMSGKVGLPKEAASLFSSETN